MKFPKKNPFAIAPTTWRATLTAPMAFAVAFEEALAEEALATSSFEDAPDSPTWQVEILFDHLPDARSLRDVVGDVARNAGIPAPEIELNAVEDRDWLVAVARDFPPMMLGRFFVHGKHAASQKPAGAIPLQVEAGMAFGSGEHATTSGCLLAIDHLSRERAFDRVLDMGCGSGILAIAAAKTWRRAEVLAADVDPVSVKVTQENLRINRVSDQVKARVSDGYRGISGQYDLILSNILARPLVKFSGDLARTLMPGGVAVLSGLLTTQEPQVLSAHRRQGLRLTQRYLRQGWSTLVLEKRG